MNAPKPYWFGGRYELSERDLLVIRMMSEMANMLELPADGQLEQFYRFADAMLEARERCDRNKRET